MNKIQHLVDQAVNAIIRPPRRNYDPTNLPLFLDAHDDHVYVRHPMSFENNRHQKLVGSIYLEASHDIMNGGPCVIYLHGNASSQQEGQTMVPNFCPYGVAVFCFDFAGCGASGGDYISLGYFETEDTELLMSYLHMTFGFGPFVLWGRSMGAATSLLVRHPLLVGRIADSAYTSIYDLCVSIGQSVAKIPASVIPLLVSFLKGKIQSIANFNIYDVSVIDAVKEVQTVPLYQAHAPDDEFVPYEQGEQLFKAYNSTDKTFYEVKNGHNGRRERVWMEAACKFALRQLGIDDRIYVFSHFYGLHSSSHHFKSFDQLLAFSQTGQSVDSNDHSSDVVFNEPVQNSQIPQIPDSEIEPTNTDDSPDQIHEQTIEEEEEKIDFSQIIPETDRAAISHEETVEVPDLSDDLIQF